MGASSEPATHDLHARLLRDHRIQFDFSSLRLPDPHLPKWLQDALQAVGKVFAAAFPAIRVVFWIGVAAAVATALFLIVRELAGARWRGLRRKAAPRPPLTDFAPDRVKALALLEDADRLAAAGRFDEAARLLLHRSIGDIEARRPRLVRPALTAREIAGLDDLPAAARACFAAMAAIVERSAFASRRLAREEFLDCRATYERFAFPDAWA
jgi:hypothetical protein